jgi:hypothetical protein
MHRSIYWPSQSHFCLEQKHIVHGPCKNYLVGFPLVPYFGCLESKLFKITLPKVTSPKQVPLGAQGGMSVWLLSFLGFFGGTEVWTQDFALTKQALYHLSYTSSPFCSVFIFFWRWGSHKLCLSLPRTMILPISASQVVRITGMNQCPAIFISGVT